MNRTQRKSESYRRALSLRHAPALLTLLACCALQPAVAADSKTGNVYGRVSNAATGDFVARARVTVEGTNIETFTNDLGEYSLDLPAGPVKLRVSYTGINDKVVDVEILADEVLMEDVTIASKPASKVNDKGEEIVVMDAFAVREARETNAYNIAANEQRYAVNLKNVVSADAFGDVTEGNVGEFIKYLPGVTVDYVAADVRTMAVRGFPDTFTSISFDGNRVASASSGNAQRSFEFEQVSLNNITRVELIKVPTPDMPADALGGAVNMVSKSAFERAKAQFSFRAYLSMNSEDTDVFKKTPGPGNKSSYKTLPGFDFDYSIPVTKKFGLVVSGLSSNQFNEQHRTQSAWNFAQAGATVSNPFLQQYSYQDGPKNTFRQALFLKGEYKVAPGQLLTASAQFNHYESNFGNRNLNWDVGTNATPSPATGTKLTWGSDFTEGASGRGSVRHGSSFRDKYGQLIMFNLGYRYTGREWTADTGASYSNSRSWYRDTQNGHFDEIRTTLLNVSRVRYAGIQPERPTTIEALTSAGAVVDSSNLANYRLDTVRSRPVDGEDDFKNVFLNIKRDFAGSLPFSLKAGGSWRRQNRDLYKEDKSWNFLGLNGSTNAAPFLDTGYTNQDPGWGHAAPQWPSPYVAYETFQNNAAAFTQTTAQILNAEKYRIRNSQEITEDVPAVYLMGEVKAFDNRLRVVGGVRYEKTIDKGLGALTKGPGSTLTDVNSNWKERGLSVEESYDDFYPSLSATYNFTNDLLVRFAYAKTFGRPDFNNIIPSVRINDTSLAVSDDVGEIGPYTVIANNTGLRPWSADSFDLSLEYYMPKDKGSGFFGMGVFQKNLADFWGTVVRPVSQADIDTYGLPQSYVDTFTMRTMENAGDAKITGVEANLSQPLKFLPWYFSNLTLTANYTKLNLSGPNNADFARFIEDAGNVGLTYKQSPVILMVKFNYRGEQRNASQTGAQYEPNTKVPVNGFYEYYAPRLNIDVNAECKITRHLSIFANARNILNEPQDLERTNATSPDYASLYRRENYGVQIAMGVKGSW